MNRTFRFAALAAAPLMVAAAPVAAKDAPAAPVLLTAVTAAQGDAAASGREQRFCTKFDQPHSVLDRRICRTKARWAARGHDISAL